MFNLDETLKDLGISQNETNIDAIDINELNQIFECNGIPKGKIIELIGHNDSGKTLILLEILSQLQDKAIVYVDCKHDLSLNYLNGFNIQKEHICLVRPTDYDEMKTMLELMIPYSDIVIIDSIYALTSKKNKEESLIKYASNTKPLSNVLRFLDSNSKKFNVPIIITNKFIFDITTHKDMPYYNNLFKLYASFRYIIYSSYELNKELIKKISMKTLKNKIIENENIYNFVYNFKEMYFRGKDNEQ